MTAFPATPVLDSFKRATEKPLDNGGKWEKLSGTGGKGTVQNEKLTIVRAYEVFKEQISSEGAIWVPTEFFEPSVILRVVKLPNTEERFPALWCCVKKGEKVGYRAKFQEEGIKEELKNRFIVYLERWDAGKRTVLKEVLKVEMKEGQWIGLTAMEGKVKAWVLTSETEGTVVAEHADSTYVKGYIGWQAGGTTQTFTGFGGESTVVGVEATATVGCSFGMSGTPTVEQQARATVESVYGVEARARQMQFAKAAVEAVFEVHAEAGAFSLLIGSESEYTHAEAIGTQHWGVFEFTAPFGGKPAEIGFRTNGEVNTGVTSYYLGIFTSVPGTPNTPGLLVGYAKGEGVPPINTTIVLKPLTSLEAPLFLTSGEKYFVGILPVKGTIKLNVATGLETGTNFQKLIGTEAKPEVGTVRTWSNLKFGPAQFFVRGVGSTRINTKAKIDSKFNLTAAGTVKRNVTATLGAVFGFEGFGAALKEAKIKAIISAIFGVVAYPEEFIINRAPYASHFTLKPEFQNKNVEAVFTYGHAKRSYHIRDHFVIVGSPLETSTVLETSPLLETGGEIVSVKEEIINVWDEDIKQGLRDLEIFEEIKE